MVGEIRFFVRVVPMVLQYVRAKIPNHRICNFVLMFLVISGWQL